MVKSGPVLATSGAEFLVVCAEVIGCRPEVAESGAARSVPWDRMSHSEADQSPRQQCAPLAVAACITYDTPRPSLEDAAHLIHPSHPSVLAHLRAPTALALAALLTACATTNTGRDVPTPLATLYASPGVPRSASAIYAATTSLTWR